MPLYKDLSKPELCALKEKLTVQYEAYKAKGMKLTMARGIPGADQLDLTTDMMTILKDADDFKSGNTDTRSYGVLEGLPEARELFAELLDVKPQMVLVGGNSSLNMMYDAVARAWTFGVLEGEKPWGAQKVKFLCPVPGYDRHFAITELFGAEMVNIPMDENGPDMALVKQLVESDASVKGMWCVPKYSNPSGLTYSDEVVRAIAALKPAANDFRVFWDNAYVIHDIYDEGDKLMNIFDACREFGSEDMIYEFCSTSKISFPGAGVAAVAMSEKNVAWTVKHIGIQTIGSDKINQLRHVRYFKNADGIKAHMRRHAELIRPKFETVLGKLEQELAPTGIASWIKPHGGYFISLDVMDGTARRTLSLAKEAGVTLTPAGSTYPYKKDPNDRNIRIAPTYPSARDLAVAIDVLCVCARLAAVEKLL